MKADDMRMLDFIGQNQKVFCIPVYQRNYDWKITHCKRLFDDIISLINNKKESHFIGTIVYIKRSEGPNSDNFIIIDGQQRVTSIMLLFKAICLKKDNVQLEKQIKCMYLTNQFMDKESRLKLKTVQADRRIYHAIMNDTPIEEKSNLKINYDYFTNQVINCEYSSQQIFNAIAKLSMVYIELSENNENPQLIFESLNSTGLDLSQADLIRNYLLMNRKLKDQEKLYNEYWVKIEKLLPENLISSFIRDYLTYKSSDIPVKDKVYEVFKKYCIENSINGEAINDLFYDLLKFAKWYSWFYFKNSPSIDVNERLKKIAVLKSTIVYPYLLEVFDRCYGKSDFIEKDLCNCLDIIIAYLFKRLLCDYPTSGINKIFSALKLDIEKKYVIELPYSQNLAISLMSKKGKANYPKDELIRSYLLTRDSYHFKHRKFLLYEIEAYKNKEVVDYDVLTTEHIMPQTMTRKWREELGDDFQNVHNLYLHNLGNLTLTGENSELSNKSFKSKKEILIRSNLRINRSICNNSNWGSEEITKRANEIIDLILEVWKMPIIEEKYLTTNQVDLAGDININDDVDVTNTRPYEIIILGERYPVANWKDTFIKVCAFFYEYEFSTFLTLINHADFKGRNRIIITDSCPDPSKYYKLAKDIFICTNLRASSILDYIKVLVEKFDEYSEEVYYKIK